MTVITILLRSTISKVIGNRLVVGMGSDIRLQLYSNIIGDHALIQW